MSQQIGGFSPNLGLERIDQGSEPIFSLPAQHETQLIGEQVRQRVSELFGNDSLDQTMRRFIIPRLGNPAIVTPARFEALVRDCAQRLRAAADTCDSTELRLAAEQLDQELQLRGLLASYRGLLMRV